ncbi:gibberellin 20-oxidase, putative [Talaromyces stipitatus ATCC 10500]|uniref:Gibberellin 20-oxidase, putative n=1 Tax=Talaromyces stipitatus (strain ATCC 10500 / CBS 375.48 / QM 6759 / NRRL 1006) TaxID=441959 RepID=B8MNM8_TALSN|nr:gibberellin 20-oxidase, putative [Talaromyces stipitatus ATCC 10500]XP_002486356.1 gibberellin 20-oxidase, putative [Talaromyces stipitatus ATCC 10500]EED14117.1 gibberellin 20-oxidase, putative [Talaromyces stipitatus ATCC 10500]EED14118.1 gibberellin 20-oxidase, putative [Talaromyces stipitatus ATCC 10500]
MGTIAEAARIPIIDLELAHTGSPEDVAKVAHDVYQAFKHVGFAYIKNHGVPQELINEAFGWSSKFFALPQADKEKAPHPPEGWYHRGYSGIGREKVVQMVFDKDGIAEKRKVPDVKESFEIGSESDDTLRNIWVPEEILPGFRGFFNNFFQICSGLETLMLRLIAIGMGLEENFLLDYHKNHTNQCRLLHYPPVEEELLRQGKAERIAAHSDFGTMTILFQDEVGGLEVEDIHDKGKFIPAPHIPGTAVVNIGDLLMRWSNDELKSTLHRVRAPPLVDNEGESKGRMTKARYSIPYFISPDRDRLIECLPNCHGPDRPKKYEAITSSDYISMRLNATY